MNYFLRAAMLISFTSSLLSIVVFAYPALAGEELDWWNANEHWARRSAAEESIRRIQRDDEIVMNRIAFKKEVIRDLVDERITFEDAAARFAESHRNNAASLKLFRQTYPGTNDQERARWQLIRHLRTSGIPQAEKLGEQWRLTLEAAH